MTLSSGRVRSASESLYDWVLSLAISEFVVDVHREAKLGLLFLSVPDKHAERRFTLHDRAGVDVFGRSIAELTKQSRAEQCLCPQCDRVIGANRSAPHLAKCMGMGRTGTRHSARRATQTHHGGGAHQAVWDCPQGGSRASSNERWSPSPALLAGHGGRANRSPVTDDDLSEAHFRSQSESKASSYCDTNPDESDDDWSEHNFKLRASAQSNAKNSSRHANSYHRHGGGISKKHRPQHGAKRKSCAGLTKSQSAQASLWAMQQGRADRGWTVVPGLQMETGDDDDWSRTPSPRNPSKKSRGGRSSGSRRSTQKVGGGYSSLEQHKSGWLEPQRPSSSNGEDSRGSNAPAFVPPAAQLAVDFERILDHVDEHT